MVHVIGDVISREPYMIGKNAPRLIMLKILAVNQMIIRDLDMERIIFLIPFEMTCKSLGQTVI